MKRFIFNYLHFSRKERLGTIALAIICALVFILPEIVRKYTTRPSSDFSQFQADILAFRTAMEVSEKPADASSASLFYFDPNTASFDDFVRLGLSDKVANIICNYRDKGGKFRRPEDFQKIWSLSKEDFERLQPFIRMESEGREPSDRKWAKQVGEPFSFDPNLATEQELLRLGLPQWTVRSILNFRSKGGVFRKKEDFKKIYTLSDDDYERLESYIVFQQAAVATAEEGQRPVTYSGGGTQGLGIQPSFAAKGPLDINRSSMEDWQRLPGIGEKRARQIVNFREALGGFLSVEQVKEVYGLPDSVFQNIQPMLVLAPYQVRAININTASEEDMGKHPYVSKKQAKHIVAYREQHGAFASVDDLTKIIALTDKQWLDKVRPYLGVW
ncbi:MAG: helix-hairpin-helix domain-containing protein [Saprospiraceae bacterium]|nr:helix-hairpin-helix domain-containing protein [Saprospiraceae bacterium]